MKLSRLAAPAIGVALVAVSALVLSSSAVAATPGVTHLTAADIPVTNTAGDAGWTKFSFGAFTSSNTGLAMPDAVYASYGPATPISATTGTALADFAQGTTFSSSDNDNLWFGITMFDALGGQEDIFTLNDPANLSDPTADWYPANFSGQIGNLVGAFTLAALDTELSTNSALAGWTIRSFTLEPDAALSLYTATINGTDFSFMPEPVVTAAPTTATQAAFGSTGLTYTTSGFLPGEEANVFLGTSLTGVAGPADGNGVITYKLVGLSAAEAVGDYTVRFVGLDTAVEQSFDFAVTANAAAGGAVVNGAALPNTGADALTQVLIAAALLFCGTAALVVSARRRAFARN